MRKLLLFLFTLIIIFSFSSCFLQGNSDNSDFVKYLSDEIKEQTEERNFISESELSEIDDTNHIFSGKMILELDHRIEITTGNNHSKVDFVIVLEDSFETKIKSLIIFYYSYEDNKYIDFYLSFSDESDYIEINARTNGFIEKIKTLTMDDIELFLVQFDNDDSMSFLTEELPNENTTNPVNESPILEDYIQYMDRHTKEDNLSSEDYSWIRDQIPTPGEFPLYRGFFLYIYAEISNLEHKGIYRNGTYNNDELVINLYTEDKYMIIKINYQYIDNQYQIDKISYYKVNTVVDYVNLTPTVIQEVYYESNGEELYFNNLDDFAENVMTISLDEINTVFENADFESED